MKPLLSIMCITKAESFAIPFLREMSALAESMRANFIIGADGQPAVDTLLHVVWEKVPTVVHVESKGYLESVHDLVLQQCDGRYVLRLDDDERCSPAMSKWLQESMFLSATHWKFPRAHLLGNDHTVLMHPQLWPDHQTRLSVKHMAGGRNWIHAGSPHGGGVEAPVVLEHHKFLVKSLEERKAIAARYDSIQMGAGTGGMLAFNCPELCEGPMCFGELGSGVAERVR